MAPPDTAHVIHCELCRLPHRQGALICDGCDHKLGTAPDWRVVRRDVALLRLQMGLAAFVIAALVVVNAFSILRGAYFVWFAPVFWLIFAAIRHRTLSRRLSAEERRTRASRSTRV